MSRLTPTQTAALCELCRLQPPNGKRHKRPTLEVLEGRGLLRHDGSPTALGQVTARLAGWQPNERQQELIVALADGLVSASNAYHFGGDWPRAPADVLRRLRAAGVAITHRRPRDFKATNLGHELSLILRQQELPPPVGPGGGAMSAPMSERRCRECGCTEDRACVDYWGDACTWSQRDPTICSYCDENVPCDPGGPLPVPAAFAGAGATGFMRGGA